MAGGAPSVVIVSGEASGDMHGAGLAERLKALSPGIELRGVGGRRMREAGVDLLYDSSAWSAIGITEAWKLIPSLMITLRGLKARLLAEPPDLVVLIDFGAFNVRLAQGLRGSGIKVLYYFPPGSWRRTARHEILSGIVDRIVTPFPWSAESLVKQGFSADFFGHPLLDVVKSDLSRDEFLEKAGLGIESTIIGLLPGSRKQELKYNLPAMLMAAGRLAAEMPELRFVMPLASGVDSDGVLGELNEIPWLNAVYWGESSGQGMKPGFTLSKGISALAGEDGFTPPKSPVELVVLPGMAWEVLAQSRAAIVASGTATVEAMILGCPMVIVYRGSALATLEFKLRRGKIQFIGMPNIIAGRIICPELPADEGTPSAVCERMLELIPDSPNRETMLKEMAASKAVLGESGAIEKTATVVLEMIGMETG